MSLAVAPPPHPAAGRSPDEMPSLALPPDIRLQISLDDFRELCAVNRDLRFERTAEGVLIAMTPAGVDSGNQNSTLNGRLFIWATAHEIGRLFDSSTGFTLPNGAIRSPDSSWINNDRWNALPSAQRKGFAPICPDFVAELRSPSDSKTAMRAKMAEYLANGARLGWLIDPLDSTVEIYRPERDVEVLANPKTLSGEDVLPGLVLDLKGILFV